jgi:hypothetical protein
VLAGYGPTLTHSFSLAFMTASAFSAALWHMRGGVVHRSRCWLDPVVSVWLDVLTCPRVDGGVSDGGMSRGSRGEGVRR